MQARRALCLNCTICTPRGCVPVKSQIRQPCCQLASGAYLGLSASKLADSFVHFDVHGAWPW